MNKPIDPKLAKFIADSKVKERMYHATNADFKSFRPNFRGAHFVTPSRDFANEHIGDDAFTGSTQAYEEGANIMPVHVQVKNPFDYQKLEHVKKLFRQAKKEKVPLDRDWKQGIVEGNWDSLENEKLMRAMKNLGHDAMHVEERDSEGEPIKNLGIFDPRKIKSAIGNRGTYDTNDPDITKADGGPVPSGPPPDIAAKLAELKEQLRQQGQDFNRRQQGIINMEKMSGPVKLLTDKAKGGLAHMADGGSDEYQGSHKPPSDSYGAPLHDLTQVYPEDIYSNKALQYYGMGHPEHKKMDMESLFKAQLYRNKPNSTVSIFRAVPEHVNEINPRDWVTLSPLYAKLHGESRLGGKYKVLKKTAKAKELWTAGDSIHEWGYHPEENKARGGRVTHAHHLQIEERPL
jgi:hypothetical protein